MERDEYVAALRALLSRDPALVRDANRVMYSALVRPTGEGANREADLVLAEVAASAA